jgi:DNA polymerase III delta prime subunit
MHAYLIVGENPALEINKLAKNLNANPIEFSVNKIEEVRELNSFTNLSVDSPQAIILKNIQNCTTEALNSLLKNLEEPPENIYYILTCNNLSQVLPTIISRCEIIVSKFQLPVSNSSEAEKYMKLKIGQKFSYLDKIKTREEALIFIKDLIYYLHTKLIENTENIKIAQKVFANLNANGNINIQLTYLAVNQI